MKYARYNTAQHLTVDWKSISEVLGFSPWLSCVLKSDTFGYSVPFAELLAS